METDQPLSEANQHFPRLLRAFARGNRFVITSDGKPMAKLIPFNADDERADAARSRLMARLREFRLHSERSRGPGVCRRRIGPERLLRGDSRRRPGARRR